MTAYFYKKILVYLAGITFFVAVFFCGNAGADTVHLKNGRSLVGIIKSEDQGSVEVEVCSGGTLKLDRNSIDRIEKSSDVETFSLRRKWERQKQDYEKQAQQYKLEEEKKPKSVEFSADGNTVFVEATLNRKVKVSLVLDTGASMVMLRKKVAEQLGVDLKDPKADGKVTLADGRTVDAKHVVLESVRLEGVEAYDVDAIVLLEETPQENIRDGLLGMSFLSRFVFKIDHKEKKLILEKH